MPIIDGVRVKHADTVVTLHERCPEHVIELVTETIKQSKLIFSDGSMKQSSSIRMTDYEPERSIANIEQEVNRILARKDGVIVNLSLIPQFRITEDGKLEASFDVSISGEWRVDAIIKDCWKAVKFTKCLQNPGSTMIRFDSAGSVDIANVNVISTDETFLKSLVPEDEATPIAFQVLRLVRTDGNLFVDCDPDINIEIKEYMPLEPTPCEGDPFCVRFDNDSDSILDVTDTQELAEQIRTDNERLVEKKTDTIKDRNAKERTSILKVIEIYEECKCKLHALPDSMVNKDLYVCLSPIDAEIERLEERFNELTASDLFASKLGRFMAFESERKIPITNRAVYRDHSTGLFHLTFTMAVPQ